MEMDFDDQDTHLEVESDVFLGTCSSTKTNDKNSPWEVTLHLNDKPLLFRIDTGADVSVIPEAVCSSNYRE